MKKVLTIAGSDSTAGGGVQADLKTFEEYGVFGFSALTAIVTMDPSNSWKHQVTALSEDLLTKQLVSVAACGPLDAVKTAMLGNQENIEIAADFIWKNQLTEVVVDPVIACKGTAQILQPESVAGIKKYLLPQALIATPNLTEAGIISGLGELKDIAAMKKAARIIYQLGAKNVIVKGGARLAGSQAMDVFYDGYEFKILKGPKLASKNNHGAGCTFAAAITAAIARGSSAFAACKLAKSFVAAAIEDGIKMNDYVGHVWHGAYNQAQRRMENEIDN